MALCGEVGLDDLDGLDEGRCDGGTSPLKGGGDACCFFLLLDEVAPAGSSAILGGFDVAKSALDLRWGRHPLHIHPIIMRNSTKSPIAYPQAAVVQRSGWSTKTEIKGSNTFSL